MKVNFLDKIELFREDIRNYIETTELDDIIDKEPFEETGDRFDVLRSGIFYFYIDNCEYEIDEDFQIHFGRDAKLHYSMLLEIYNFIDYLYELFEN